MGIKVVKEDGSECTYGAAFGRNILRLIDVLPTIYIVGLIAIASSEKRQRIGDQAAGTVVVKVKQQQN